MPTRRVGARSGEPPDEARAARREVYNDVRRQLETVWLEREILYRALNAHLRAVNGGDRDYAAEEIARATASRRGGREGSGP